MVSRVEVVQVIYAKSDFVKKKTAHILTIYFDILIIFDLVMYVK